MRVVVGVLSFIGLAWLTSLAWLGLAWLDLTWLGLAWLDLTWLGLYATRNHGHPCPSWNSHLRNPNPRSPVIFFDPNQTKPNQTNYPPAGPAELPDAVRIEKRSVCLHADPGEMVSQSQAVGRWQLLAGMRVTADATAGLSVLPENNRL